MRSILKKKLHYLIDSLDEAAYRKGYSHGYYTSKNTKTKNCSRVRSKILDWVNDLNIKTGAPGSFLEENKQDWTNIDKNIFSNDELVLSLLTKATYSDENGEKKKYSVYDRELYRNLYFLSKDDGYVMATTEKLAELCNMSKGSVSNSKKILSRKCDLTGHCLISVEIIKIKTESEKGINYSDCHKIKINLI